MIGTIVESELGGPIHPSASGPSQPSAPMIQISDMIRPRSVISRSENVRMNRRIRSAISTSAIPISGSSPDSVASVYSSSTTAGDTTLTRSGPSSAVARSLIRRSTSKTRSSPVSSRRMLAMATGVPVRVDAGEGVEHRTDLRDVTDGVDLRLCERREVVGAEHESDQRTGCDDRVVRRQQGCGAGLGEDVVEEGVHLGQPAGCQRLAAEDQRRDIDGAVVPEELIDVGHRGGDIVPGGKQFHRRPLGRRRAPCRPHGQHDGHEDEDTDGDPRAGCDQPAEPVEQAAHGVRLYLTAVEAPVHTSGPVVGVITRTMGRFGYGCCFSRAFSRTSWSPLSLWLLPGGAG